MGGIASVVYGVIIYLEERDLIALFGDEYRRYREQVSMLIPRPGWRFRGAPPDLGPHHSRRSSEAPSAESERPKWEQVDAKGIARTNARNLEGWSPSGS